jgi:acetylornithine deacetylase/succinyl-diaminopimelate desuccinylase-like protein
VRTVDELRGAVTRVMPSVRDDLEALIRIPSVSADPAAAEAIRRSAVAVSSMLKAAVLDQVEVLEIDGGHPSVFGRWPAPSGAPTVLLYAHHDVQPPGDRRDWDSDPFEPVERDGRLFARGAADDKAGVALHLAALRAVGDDLDVGVTILVEGEEEIGSPTLDRLLAQHGDRLAADVIVLADSTNWRIGVPALTTSLRGGFGVTVEVRTLRHAVHNGVYGGPVPDALTALARLLATLHDENGDVAVAGLRSEPADALDLTEEQLRADAGMLDGVRLLGTGTLTSRLWTHPAISISGIDAPTVDTAPMTLAPSARARLSVRIPPGQDPQAARDAVLAHLQTHAPWGASVTVSAGNPVRPFAARTGGPGYATARAALAQAWGADPVEAGVGGSINFVRIIAERFPHAEILITGVEDPDTRAHAPNESLHLGEFERACVAEALFLTRLAAAWRPSSPPTPT